jgi:glucose-1-phosphate adenylyltransferase
MEERSIAFILAGGKGDRLQPLTDDRAKPAVPFSKYRIIDHNASAIINAGIETILFPSQFEPRSLHDHIDVTYSSYRKEKRKISPVPPKQKRLPNGETILEPYKGTADAVLQNIKEITVYNGKPEHVLVFAADHISNLDVRDMMRDHHREDRDLTIAVEVRPIKKEDFEINSKDGKLHYKYGVILADENKRITGFSEKPLKEEMQKEREPVLVSMGNYIFHSSPLVYALKQGFGDDFGKEVIPGMVKEGKNVFVYKFNGYWRDVGDILSYFDACIDLNDENPKLNYKILISEDRPVITAGGISTPARITSEGKISTISEGCEIYGKLENCVLGQNVLVGHGCYLRNTIVFPDVEIEPGVTIQNAIIDKNNIITTGTTLGYNQDLDKKRGYTIIDREKDYLVVVPRIDPR